MLSGAFATAIGRVSDAPRIKADGTKMASFRIGCCEKVKEEWVWSNFDVVVFGRLADIVEQYVEKGSEVLVTGQLRQRDFTDGEGNKRTAFQITADKLQLGAKPKGQGDGNEKTEQRKTESKASKPATKAIATDDFPDDVPF